MSQNASLIQVQKGVQQQKLTPQQLLVVRMTEMPIAELEVNVKDELDNNIVLEEGKDSKEESFNEDWEQGDSNGDGGGEETELQLQLGEYSSDDDTPDYLIRKNDYSSREAMPIGQAVTFLDDLTEQIVNYDLDEHQRELVEYLIGSLNDKGFLDLSLSRIADELYFKQNIETNEEELEEALKILQQFEPSGIGARNSQESLLIQIDRKLEDDKITPERKQLLLLERRIIADEYEPFTNSNLEKIAKNLSEDIALVKYAVKDIGHRLNPHPGTALCESASDRVETAIPDFTIERDSEGNVSFQLNYGEVPSLRISPEYTRLTEQYLQKGGKIGRSEKESLDYYKASIDKAKMYIDAIKQRHTTLTSVMKAIIIKQKTFFQTTDEEDLQYLIYKDIADMIQMDVSTVSRACKSKYALMDGRMYELTYFFKRKRTNAEGSEIDSINVKDLIMELVDNEDKNHPLSDDQLVEELGKRNIKIARRTINKYRTELAIPNAKNRKS